MSKRQLGGVGEPEKSRGKGAGRMTPPVVGKDSTTERPAERERGQVLSSFVMDRGGWLAGRVKESQDDVVATKPAFVVCSWSLARVLLC